MAELDMLETALANRRAQILRGLIQAADLQHQLSVLKGEPVLQDIQQIAHTELLDAHQSLEYRVKQLEEMVMVLRMSPWEKFVAALKRWL